jgi:hypothetical protein
MMHIRCLSMNRESGTTTNERVAGKWQHGGFKPRHRRYAVIAAEPNNQQGVKMRAIAAIIGLYITMVCGSIVIDAATPYAHALGPCTDARSSAWNAYDCARSPSNDLTCDPILNHGNWQQCNQNQYQRQQGIQARLP